MPTYTVINKPHIRTSLREETILDANKQPFTVFVPGPLIRLDVGTVLTDVNAEELAAFPDRFKHEKDEPANAPLWSGSPPKPPDDTPMVRQLNPELFNLVLRVQQGQGSGDEEILAPDILGYLVKHNAGTVTAEDTANLEAELSDFGLTVFA